MGCDVTEVWSAAAVSFLKFVAFSSVNRNNKIESCCVALYCFVFCCNKEFLDLHPVQTVFCRRKPRCSQMWWSVALGFVSWDPFKIQNIEN